MSKENTPTPDAVEQEEVLSRDADKAQDCLEQTEKQEVVNDALSDRITELEEENRDLKEQLLRKQADFENFRKRLIRDKEDSIKYGNSNLLLDLVSVMDDFERAIKSSGESKDFESFHSGVEMIEKQMASLLERKYGLKRFESEGEVFDPEKHEAITMEDSVKHKKMVVLEDFQKGYLLHERVLRHSKVKVANPVKKLADESQTEPDQAETE